MSPAYSTTFHGKSTKRLTAYSRTRVETGIRSDRHGFEAYVKVNGRSVSHRFSSTTSLTTIRLWRAARIADAQWDRECEALAPQSRWPKAPSGWCYIYFLRKGDMVKIGRSADPQVRLRELQTGQAETLEILVAVPAHADLEKALHERFARQRCGDREWFRLDADLFDCIRELSQGKNPIALLW